MQRPARPSSSWWGLLALAIAACAPFGSSSTATVDTGEPDASSGETADAAGASPDAGVEERPDASDESCSSDAVVVGTSTEGAEVDRVPARSVDAYGFTASGGIASVIARCVKLYVADVSKLAGGNIVVGVYSDVGNKPGLLVAKASFASVKVGWNTAFLDAPLTVAPSGSYWLAFTPTDGEFSVLANGTCAQGQRPRSTRNNLTSGELPSPFEPTGNGPECGASVLLAR